MINVITVEEIKENWQKVVENVNAACEKSGRNPADIQVIAVSKTHSAEVVVNALNAGISVFGENYAQELRDKHKTITEVNGIKPLWHFIGHLQRNKVKYIAPFVEYIHTVDSVKLALEISKQAAKNNRVIKCLLQVNTSGEESKSGCEPRNVMGLVDRTLEIPGIKIQGLMTIGSFSENEKIVRGEFEMLREIKEKINSRFPDADYKHLSMGMSHDYPWAIEEGATFVRVGTSIFGYRSYQINLKV
jgi:pyridoxal phosphate enzyme (YggS family)